MSLSLNATQIGLEIFRLDWTIDEAPPVAGWQIRRLVPEPLTLITYNVPTVYTYVSYEPIADLGIVDGDLMTWRCQSQTTGSLDTASVLYRSAGAAVDPNVQLPRYTTLDEVKARLRIPPTTTTFDDRITEAIVAGEYSLDAEMGRSFPDGPTELTATHYDNVVAGITAVPITVVPVAVKNAATQIAMRLYKAGDAPAGVAGSDDMFGALDLTEAVRAEISRSPVLRGFKVSWGIS